MSDKPTPETDAELERSLRACHSYACGPDFARKLERERDDYKNHFEACEAQREALNQQLATRSLHMREVELHRAALLRERDELRAEVERLTAELVESNRILTDDVKRVHGLAAEVEKLKADKVRLDWLFTPNTQEKWRAVEALFYLPHNMDAREAIDAAMKGELK